jgi:23S rRNA pseudouridine2605 synthase
MTAPTRLNRYLALSLGVSRREADELISSGKVTVNDTTAELGGRVSSGDDVRVDNQSVRPQTYQYVAFHKPVGYVCSRKRQGDTPTIYELLPEEYHNLKPVGRLDKDSSGLLLLSNDGDFTQQMTHPSYHKTKIYEVSLDHDLQPLHQQMISDFGVMLEDGKSQFLIERIDQVTALSDDDQNSRRTNRYKITMSEGRNRQIRRTFAALGYTVVSLHRQTFGRFTLDGLKPGVYSPLALDDARQ